MIKNTLKIFFGILFLLMKKIFIRKNRVPHKLMDNFANKLHSIFVYTSFGALYLLWFDIKPINLPIYILLFLQVVIITRYFNQKMLVKKELQIKIVKRISRFSLFIFIFNWIFLSFGLAFLFIVVTLFNFIIYIFIIDQLEKQKEQEEFKKQFGEGSYSKEDIVKKHILNLFEENLPLAQITKSDVKKQYRLMAKKYHPDVYKGDEEDKFTSINSSYTFLLDLIK